LFKQFADESDKLDAFSQLIKDFIYQATVLLITCGYASINPVRFGMTELANLFWNLFIEKDHPKERIRTLFPVWSVMLPRNWRLI